MSDPLALINGARMMHALPALKRSRRLDAHAAAHAGQMAQDGAPEPREATGVDSSLSAAGIPHSDNVGSTRDARDPILALHKLFMQDNQQRANILDPRFRWVGIGLHTVEGVTWCAQAFGVRPSTSLDAGLPHQAVSSLP